MLPNMHRSSHKSLALGDLKNRIPKQTTYYFKKKSITLPVDSMETNFEAKRQAIVTNDRLHTSVIYSDAFNCRKAHIVLADFKRNNIANIHFTHRKLNAHDLIIVDGNWR